MPINLPTFLRPTSSAIPFLLEDVNIKGGLRTVEALTDRDAIPSAGRKAGMLVAVAETGLSYTLAADLVTWSEYKTAPMSHVHSASEITTTDETHRFVTDVEKTSWSSKQDALGFTPEDSANRAVPNGYATLGADGLLEGFQRPPMDTTAINVALGYVPANQADVGNAGGIATLGQDGKLSPEQSPDINSTVIVGALGFTPVDSILLAAANGVATLDGAGKVLASQLPEISPTGQPLTAESISNALGYTPVNPASVAAPDGLASLDSAGKVPLSQIPDGIGGGGGAPLTNANIIAGLGFTPVDAATLAQPNGVATLNTEGKLTEAQMPAMSSSGVSATLGFLPVDSATLAQPLGVATLDANGKVVDTQLPTLTVTSETVKSALGYTPVSELTIGQPLGVAALDANGQILQSAIPELDLAGRMTPDVITGALGYTPANQADVGSVNGIASLDGNGKLLVNQLPALPEAVTFAVDNEAAMLLQSAKVGDIAVCTLSNRSYVLKTLPASVLSNWQELLAGAAVSSVNGKVGAVSLALSDLTGASQFVEQQISSSIPPGAVGQVPFIKTSGTRESEQDFVLHVGQFINSDEEFTSAQQNIVSMETVFTTWKRFSHNGAETQPANPAEMSSWAYNAALDSVSTTTNSNTYIGFVSDKEYSEYTHEVQLASTNVDDDTIAVILAWSVDAVTGREHTLSAVRSPGGVGVTWQVVYNYLRSDSFTVSNKNSTVKWGNGNYGETAAISGYATNQAVGGWDDFVGTNVKIVRAGDIFTCDTSDLGQTSYVAGAQIVVDLTSDARLAKFRGPRAYGYAAYSQASSTYKVLEFSGAINVIYDMRDGLRYEYKNGVWVQQSKTVWSDIGVGRFAFNPISKKMFYVDTSASVLNVSTNVEHLPSTAGTYAKVTVNGTGHVVAGSSLVESDIPQISWSKISNPPNSTAAYGITDAVTTSQKGAANGVATLGADGKIVASQIPAIAIANTYTAATESAMLALTADIGDIAVRTDLNDSFILKQTPANVLSNWQQLLTPTASVSSVNGMTGAVTLSSVSGNAGTATKLQTARSIGLTGALTGSTNFDGSTNITINATLSDSGAVPGTYSKVTVNGKGIVTSATALTANDIPGMEWSRVINKPTTLAGYGITDQLSAHSHAAVVFNSSGNGAASDATYNAVNGFVVSYNTVGAPSSAGVGASGTWNIDISGKSATTAQTNFTNLTIGTKQVLYADNYNSYAPSLTGVGASGTWNIAISGKAATADAVPWTGVANRPTKLSQFINDLTVGANGRAYPRRSDGNNINFIWSGQSGQPTWLWGGTDGINMYVYNPSNFSVAYAASSGKTNRTVDAVGALRIANPGGAAYSGPSSVTGAIKIKLPVTAFKNATMMTMTVNIYNYTGDAAGKSTRLRIGGYNYSDANGNWYHYFATQETMGGADLNVRFGRDTTSNCIWIGDANTVWSHPGVTVSDFEASYTGATEAAWATGWSISVTTSITTVTQGPIVAAKNVTSKNFNSYAPTLTGVGASGTSWNIGILGNAATATKAASLTTARTISLAGAMTGSTTFNGSANVSITTTLANSGVAAGTYPKVTVNTKGLVTSASTLVASDIPALDWSKITSGKPTTLVGYGITDAINVSQKGVANGVATLDGAGLVPANQLPSFVDDVLEYASLAAFPATGTTGKIFVALDTNKCYRWSGSTYVYITSGAVDSVAGKTGVVTLVKSDVGLGNVDNTSDVNKPVSTAQQTAINSRELAIAAGTTAQYWRGDKTWQALTASAVGLGSVSNTAQVTAVTATGPVVSSGGLTPVISMPAATAGVNGYMTAAYASKLDGIAAGATAYIHPAGDGNLHVPATGTTNNGKVLRAGATAGSLSWVSQPYDISQFINGKPLASETLVRVIAPRVFSLAANFAGCYAYCTTTATASAVFNLLKNGANVGTVTFAVGATSGTFSATAGVTFNAGDQFVIQAPETIDSTLSDLAFTMSGSL